MAKGKKKDAGQAATNAIPEVDKTFYELTIADLNRKIAQLRTSNTEFEDKNEELEKKLKTIDEDRNDVICYLKRVVQEKVRCIKALNEKIEGLEEVRRGETEVFKKEMRQLNDEFKQMNEQLTSEIKLLSGKLNSLDEFRVQKEDLMKKFDLQEKRLSDQELKHKQELYETEKKFVIGKDTLKKDMESRLLQLSTDFQNITELRIASTTHRVIRENISVNNELNVMFETHRRLQNQNKVLKDLNKTLQLEASLHEEEKKKAMSKTTIQFNLIKTLTEEHEELTKKLRKHRKTELEMAKFKKEINNLILEVQTLQQRTRVLEQNLHASRCERNGLKMDLDYTKDELERVTCILRESVNSIKEALQLSTVKKPKGHKAPQNDKLLSNLLELLSKAKEEKIRRPSLESVESISATYMKGDLGFVPKPVILPSKIVTKQHKEVQQGQSFEELVANYVPPPPKEIPVDTVDTVDTVDMQ